MQTTGSVPVSPDVTPDPGGRGAASEDAPEALVQCPYCQARFRQKRARTCASWASRCPRCGKVLLLPVGMRPPIAYRVPPEPRERVFLPPRTGSSDSFALAYARTLRSPRVYVIVVVTTALVTMAWLTSRQRVPSDPTPALFAKTAEVTENLRVLRTALELYRGDCHGYPTTEQSLKALVRNPMTNGWNGPYIDALKPDPWYRSYAYTLSNNVVALKSAGPDGVMDTRDDVVAPPPDLSLLAVPVTPEPR